MRRISECRLRTDDGRKGAAVWLALATWGHAQTTPQLQIQGAQPPDPTPTPIPEIKDITPPFYIPILPMWAWIVITIVATLLVAWAIFFLVQRSKRKGKPPVAPREAALAELQTLEPEIDSENPLEFTVETAGVLRKYVVSQFGIPATKQTSQEFLQSLRNSGRFSGADRELLQGFLDKADLIEFAKYQATHADSRELWIEAKTFVEGSGQLTHSQPPPLPGGLAR